MGVWQKKIIPIVKEKLSAYTYRPTIRGMFYNLVSDEKLQNTPKQYKSLVSALSTARRNGTIPISAFVDTTRWIDDIYDDYQKPEEYIQDRIDNLKTTRDHYFDSIPRWHRQKHYVEVWVEKNALRGLFAGILNGMEIRVVPNNGWSSMVYRQENIDRLIEKRSSDTDQDGNRFDKKVHILYFGDYDPTGRKMDRNIALDLVLALEHGYSGKRLEKESERLRRIGGAGEIYEGELYDRLDEAKEMKIFQRVALTKEQITDFKLEHLKNTNPDVLAKLKKDPNREDFVRENGSLFQIEVDAMQRDPQKFKELVLSSVNDKYNYFDEKIHNEVMEEYTPEYIDRIINEKLKFTDEYDPFT
jgi:hypothetical protein